MRQAESLAAGDVSFYPRIAKNYFYLACIQDLRKVSMDRRATGFGVVPRVALSRS